MISKTSLHAIRAIVVLSKLKDKQCAGAVHIAKEIDAPQNYLGKLLQNLTRAGIVESQKGLGGGFRLARDPKKITIFDIIDPIEQVSRWEECILGHKECSDETACATHYQWKKIRESYLALLKETTVHDLVSKGELEKILA